MEVNRASRAISSRLPKSSTMPSFRTAPNSFQSVAYLSGSFSEVSLSCCRTFLTALERIRSTTRLPCRSSRDTLSGRSAESITPRMKRRYLGISWPESSMMKIRLTCSLTPRDQSRTHRSYGACEPMYSSSVYS